MLPLLPSIRFSAEQLVDKASKYGKVRRQKGKMTSKRKFNQVRVASSIT